MIFCPFILSFITISSFCQTHLLSCTFVTNNCLIFRYRPVSCWSRGQSRTDKVRHFQNLSQSLYIPTGRVHFCFWWFISSAVDLHHIFFIWFSVYFQGGPYHDVLHSILGAYTCYRPDVGYVSTRLVLLKLCLVFTTTNARTTALFTSKSPLWLS